MLLPEEHDAYELKNCLDDVYGVWPFMDKLPTMSSAWKEDLEYAEMAKVGGCWRRFFAVFGTSQLAVYYKSTPPTVHIKIEDGSVK